MGSCQDGIDGSKAFEHLDVYLAAVSRHRLSLLHTVLERSSAQSTIGASHPVGMPNPHSSLK